MTQDITTAFDVDRARRETPGVDSVIHLNNAGSALPPAVVTEAMVGHLRLEAAIGGYEAADRARERVDAVYDGLATLLGCGRHEVAVLENATRAWDLAFYAMRFGPGDRILTARSEYASNYIAFLQMARRTGAVVEVVPDDEHGQFSTDQLVAMLDERVKLISLNHVPTNSGLVNPAPEIGRIARAWGIPFMLDACQSVGQGPVDVAEIGCDILTAAGRKYLRGPRGTGFLYVSERLLPELEPPFLDSHSATWTDLDTYVVRDDARRFESWEVNYAAKIGLGVAVDYALDWGLTAVNERLTALTARLRERLSTMPRVVLTDPGVERCAIVTFTVTGGNLQHIFTSLRARGINTSVALAQYALMDMRGRGLTEVLRISVHYYNTEAELDRFCAELEDLIG